MLTSCNLLGDRTIVIDVPHLTEQGASDRHYDSRSHVVLLIVGLVADSVIQIRKSLGQGSQCYFYIL